MQAGERAGRRDFKGHRTLEHYGYVILIVVMVSEVCTCQNLSNCTC